MQQAASAVDKSGAPLGAPAPAKPESEPVPEVTLTEDTEASAFRISALAAVQIAKALPAMAEATGGTDKMSSMNVTIKLVPDRELANRIVARVVGKVTNLPVGGSSLNGRVDPPLKPGQTRQLVLLSEEND